MFRRPKTAVIRLIAVERLQLIIINEFYPLLRQKVLHTLKKLMRAARSPMQQQHLDPRIVPESLCPYMKLTLGSGDLNKLDIPGLHAGVLLDKITGQRGTRRRRSRDR